MPLTESYAIGPTEPPLRDITLGRLLEEAVADAPQRLALIAGTADPAARRQWTYAELHTESLRAARALPARFEPGERVAIWAPNIPEWIITEFDAAMPGVVLVTVNPSFQAREVEYVINQSKSAGILVMREFHGNQMLASVEEVRGRCPTLREIICLDQWEEFLTSAENADVVLPQVAPGDAFPLTGSGKVQKFALREQWEAEQT